MHAQSLCVIYSWWFLVNILYNRGLYRRRAKLCSFGCRMDIELATHEKQGRLDAREQERLTFPKITGHFPPIACEPAWRFGAYVRFQLPSGWKPNWTWFVRPCITRPRPAALCFPRIMFAATKPGSHWVLLVSQMHDLGWFQSRACPGQPL